jgi:hypothetical protein
MQLDTTFNIYIANRCFCIACLNNYMFRPLYRPSSGCTLPYYKANYTIYVFVFVDEISFTSIKFVFKIITVAVEPNWIFTEIKWNANMMQLGKFYWCILSSTCFWYTRPSSGALDAELKHMVFCTEFLDWWWSWEPLRRLCVRCGWCTMYC